MLDTLALGERRLRRPGVGFRAEVHADGQRPRRRPRCGGGTLVAAGLSGGVADGVGGVDGGDQRRIVERRSGGEDHRPDLAALAQRRAVLREAGDLRCRVELPRVDHAAAIVVGAVDEVGGQRRPRPWPDEAVDGESGGSLELAHGDLGARPEVAVDLQLRGDRAAEGELDDPHRLARVAQPQRVLDVVVVLVADARVGERLVESGQLDGVADPAGEHRPADVAGDDLPAGRHGVPRPRPVGIEHGDHRHRLGELVALDRRADVGPVDAGAVRRSGPAATRRRTAVARRGAARSPATTAANRRSRRCRRRSATAGRRRRSPGRR